MWIRKSMMRMEINMNFLDKFKKICANIDNPEIEIVPIKKEQTPVKDKTVKLFNIYKRSLPPGLDKVVVFGVTKEEAEMLLSHVSVNRIHLMADKAYQDDARESKTIVYYDMIPADAKPHERSIYFNSPETRKARYDDTPWIG